jgi:hypothetical protein
MAVRKPFDSSVFDRRTRLDLDADEPEPRVRLGFIARPDGFRYPVRLEETLGGRVLRVVDAQLDTVLGIFELLDPSERGADTCTYVEDIPGHVRALRVTWSTGEAVEQGYRGFSVA